MYYLYILLCKGGSLYTGITTDLNKRFKAHRLGKGSKYVYAHLPFKHIYTEDYESRSDASKREYLIKKWSRNDKIKRLGLVLS